MKRLFLSTATPKINSELRLNKAEPWVVLRHGAEWWRFAEPKKVVTAVTIPEILPALAHIQTLVSQQNLYAVGFLAYEAAAAFGLAVHTPESDGLPLLWFGLYAGPEIIAPPEPTGANFAFGAWQAGVDLPAYQAAIGQIKAAIARGHTYQVNYTFPLTASFDGDPWALFAALQAGQNAAYATYFDLGRWVIASVSPELFFVREGEQVTLKPMKGTAVRGLTLAQDTANAQALQASEKNRAENVMIVDMIRNDLGRVAQIGSVAVPQLFTAERYPTLWQMTSTVTGQTAVPFVDLMVALFPCASITGAPKIRTMQIIRDLEPAPRGVYTGALGFLAPDGRAQFSVGIRTLTLDRERGTAVYPVGSGIVWDSEATAEYEECWLKARVLTAQRPSFHLLESLLWQPESGYFLLTEHLQRLADSATYFAIPLSLDAVQNALIETARSLRQPSKVRLLVDLQGSVDVEAADLGASPAVLRLGLAQEPVDSQSVWLYHKTTQRQVYEQAKASRPECDEVLLWNERGEITEGCSHNVALEQNGVWLTPPVSAGLLAGTLRGVWLGNGRLQEQTIRKESLVPGQKVALFNSVRGWREGILILP